AKFIKASRKGVFERRLDRDAIAAAVAAGALNENDAGIMRAADEATDRAVNVDDFPMDVLEPTPPRAAAAHTGAPGPRVRPGAITRIDGVKLSSRKPRWPHRQLRQSTGAFIPISKRSVG